MKREARLRVPADVGLAIRQARLDQGLTQQEPAEIPEAFCATGINVSATWEADRA